MERNQRTIKSKGELTWPTHIHTCLITCLSDGNSFLAVTYPCKNQAGWLFWKGVVIWGQGGWMWHAPAKINWGGHSGKSQVKRLAFRTQLVCVFQSYSSNFHIQGAQTSVKHFQWFHDQWHINWCGLTVLWCGWFIKEISWLLIGLMQLNSIALLLQHLMKYYSEQILIL